MIDDAPATVLLAAPADDGGLAEELAAVAPRRWWNRATLYLGAAALLVAGFVGGIQVQQRYGEPAAGAATAGGARAGGLAPGDSASAFPGSGTGGRTGANGAAGEASGGGTTAGTVKLVDGDTVYVQTADGGVVVVHVSGATSVQVAEAGSAKDLKAGDPVTVLGESASDGSVTASSVTKQAK